MALAETVVDIVANPEPFERQFERAMLRAGRRAGRAIDLGMRNQTRQTGRVVGQRLGREINRGIDQSLRRTVRVSAGAAGGGGGFRRAGRQAGDAWSKGFEAAARRRRIRFAGDILKWLGIGTGVLTAIPAVVTGLASLTSTFGAAAGAAVALSSALAPLAGVFAGLPAAVAGGAAAVGTLAVAFRGIEDAVEAALTGDLDEFNEAIEDLAPAARRSMRELRGMRGVFEDLQNSVQGAFFGEIQGDLEALADVISGPLQRGMTGLSREFGRVASTLLEFGRTDRAASAIDAVFGSLRRATRAASSGLEPALRGIADAVIALAPQFERLGEAIGNMLTQWGEGLSDRAQSGQLTAAFERALKVAQQLERIANNLLDTFLAIGRAIERAFGGDILASFERASQRLRDWSISAEVQSGITALFADLRRAVEALGPAFQQLGRSAVQLVDAFADAVEVAGPGLVPVIRGIGDGLSALAEGAGEFMRSAGPGLGAVLRELGEALGGLLEGAGAGFGSGFRSLADGLASVDWVRVGEDLGAFFDALAQVVEDLAPSIDGLLAIAGKIVAIANFFVTTVGVLDKAIGLVQLLSGNFAGFVQQLGPTIMAAVQTLPLWIQVALIQLGQYFADLGQGLYVASSAVAPFVNLATGNLNLFLGQLGPAIVQAIAKLPPWVQLGILQLRQFFVDIGLGIVEAVNFISPWVNLATGNFQMFFVQMGPGLLEAVQSLWDWLQPILDSVSGFFNSLGGSIEGFASGLFGGGLGPWLPGMARGGVVNRATPAVVGEAGPEVVIPLRRPARARQLAAQSGLMDLLAAGGGESGSARPAGGRISRVAGGAPTPHRTAHVHAPITVTTAATDPDIVAARIAARVTRQVRGAVA